MSLVTPEEREETARRVSRVLGDDDRIDSVVIIADDEELPAGSDDWVGKVYELLAELRNGEPVLADGLEGPLPEFVQLRESENP